MRNYEILLMARSEKQIPIRAEDSESARNLALDTAAMQNLTDAAQRIRSEYNRLIDWAELYDSCSKDAKKMIIGQLVKAIYVSRGYKVRIEFNISFESFQSYAPQPTKLRQKNEPMPVFASTP